MINFTLMKIMTTENEFRLEDANGTIVEHMDSVMAPEPDDSDTYSYPFAGTVTGFRGVYAIVEDGDGDAFEIEVFRLEIINEAW